MLLSFYVKYNLQAINMMELLLGIQADKGFVPKPGSWRRITPTGTSFYNCYQPALGFKDGFLYILNGVLSSNNFSNSGRKVHVDSGTTTAINPRTKYGYAGASFQVGNTVWVFSYNAKLSNNTTISYYNKATFDIPTETWTELAAVPVNTVANSEQGFTGSNGKLFTFGGSAGSTWQATMRRFDPVTDVAVNLGLNMAGRSGLDRGAALSSVGDLIYGLGGIGQTVPYKNTIFAYDTVANTSSVVKTAAGNEELAGIRTYGSSVNYNGKIYTFFGIASNNSNPTNQISVYDPEANKLQSIIGTGETLPTARINSSAILVGNKVYLFGGSNVSGTAFNDLWEYTILD